MRDIKFRGLNDSGWVYGDLQRDSKGTFYIVEHTNEGLAFEVDSNTAGQYTGLLDKNKEEIYENDIVKLISTIYTDCSREKIDRVETFTGVVTFYQNSWCLVQSHPEGYRVRTLNFCNLKDDEDDPDTDVFEILGSEFDYITKE